MSKWSAVALITGSRGGVGVRSRFFFVVFSVHFLRYFCIRFWIDVGILLTSKLGPFFDMLGSKIDRGRL